MSFESIIDLFEQSADRFGPRTAVEQGERQTTYGEIEARANRLANLMLSHGIARGERVALLLDDRAEILAAILASLKAGCLFVPLDPATPARRLAAIAAEVTPRFFVLEKRHLARLREIEAAIEPPASGILVDGAAEESAEDAVPAGAGRLRFAALADGADDRRPARSAGPDDRCYIYFTSGSTGRPKGIVGRLAGIDHFIRWEIATFSLPAGLRVSQLTSPAFDAFLRDAFVPLCLGGVVCAPQDREILLDSRRLAGWLEATRVELVHCVPSLFRTLLNAGLNADSLPALGHVLMAGEPLLPADVNRWFGALGDRVRLVNLYGPSETTMVKLFHPVTPADAGRPIIPIGKPMKGAAALIVDAKGRPATSGQVGEILLRTPYRSHGYWGRPDLTDEVFVPNPFGKDPGDLVYRTGDLARLLPSGDYEFLGRKDQQVKIRGVRVEIDEIESLLREHPSVRDLAVAAIDDPEGNKDLCAYVVLDGPVLPGSLRDFLAERLPESMVPSYFVPLDELPRTLSGKIDRRALPLPAAAQSQRLGAFTPPGNAVEELLLEIWKEVLRVERIGIHESFFEWGGHSLLATQVLSRIRQVFDVELPLRAFFEHPTVGGLAQDIEAALRSGDRSLLPPLVPVPREGPLPLSFAQQRLWFIEHLEPESAAYNIPLSLRLRGPLSVPALRRSIDAIVRRHEVLRTTFALHNAQPVQLVGDPPPLTVPVLDLSAIADPARRGEMLRLAGEEARRPFDLSRGPLLRVTLLRLREEEHMVLFTVHHIAADAWSMGLLVGDFVSLYRAGAGGETAALPDLPLQYADFAQWQRQWLQDEILEAQLAYWRQRLSGAPPLELPADRAALAGAHRPGSQFWALPLELSRQVEELSRRQSATLFMTLLAAFSALLAYRTRQEDIVVGTDIANRNHLGTEQIMGFFINQLVLRLDLAGNPPFDELLRRVREVALGAYAHQDLPFERLVEELRPGRHLGRVPLFRAKLVLQNTPSSALELPGVTITLAPLSSGSAQFDLLLNLSRDEHGALAGRMEYSADLFDAATVARLLEQLQTTLEIAAGDPAVTLAELHDRLREDDRRHSGQKQQELKRESSHKLRSARRTVVGEFALESVGDGEI